MLLIIDKVETYLVGTEFYIDSVSENGNNAVVFEDDGETGYFYALDLSNSQQEIKDTVHIFNVKDVIDKEKPSEIKIGWSENGQIAILQINNYPHAVFDFLLKQGYCRTGLPPTSSNKEWSKNGHSSNQEVLNQFKK